MIQITIKYEIPMSVPFFLEWMGTTTNKWVSSFGSTVHVLEFKPRRRDDLAGTGSS